MQKNDGQHRYFIFDLDDTLYPEIDFVRSAFRTISFHLQPFTGQNISGLMMEQYAKGGDVFKWVLDNFTNAAENFSSAGLLKIYREHIPSLCLREDAAYFLRKLADHSIPAGLLTDGRSITQRNKIKTLQLDTYFRDVIISEEFGSEKPDEKNFHYFAEKYPNHRFCYVGDNTQKDFIVPARLGWECICIRDRGDNIHPQFFDQGANPLTVIDTFYEIPY